VLVITDHELLEGRWCEGCGLAAGGEALPAEADGAVDVDEDEEGASGEDVDEVFLPVFGGEVEEFFDCCKGLGLRCDVG
jgi:hypothetical protein